MNKQRATNIMTELCQLLNRNDDLTMQIDYFDYENLSEIEYSIEILNVMKENDELN